MASAEAVGPDSGSCLTHDAVLYRTPGDYLAALVPFLVAGVEADEPTFVAVPPRHVDLLREGLGDVASTVAFADMTELGRNPARIIPAIRTFIDDHPAPHIRFVGEPIWAGRRPEETCEATRHEAMLNTAFAETSVHIRCPYDVGRLDPAVVADSWRTHPIVVSGETTHDSAEYVDPATMYPVDDPLPPAPPTGLHSMPIAAGELSEVRQLVRRFALLAGLSRRRTGDLVLAANEIATNTLVHTDGPGMLRLWRTDIGVVCEITDTGHLTDPFAGRHVPNDTSVHGRGLWMANQLCDLVQLRSADSGTVIRLQVRHDS
jgi:anti-sigma regulatory factor (Ser/Thr protein kinase)